MLRLDPLGKHSSPPTGKVSDLAQLWRVSAEFYPEPISVAETICPLQASTKLLEKQERVNQDAGKSSAHDYFHWEVGSWSDESEEKTPGALIAQNGVIQVLCNLFDQANNSE